MISYSFDHFYEDLMTHIKNKIPFSHIRFGDGDGIVIGYPEFTNEIRTKQRWDKWLGNTNINMKEFAIKIRDSVKNCDILGIPCKRHLLINKDWRNVLTFVNKYNLLTNDQKICCMDCVLELQKRHLFGEIISYFDEIYCITCRNVRGKLEEIYKKNVVVFELPPQNVPFMGEVLTNEPHYPNRFKAFGSWINKIEPYKKLFLVGAGGLGKIYCSAIKNLGGIVLDIGSIFDGWAGLGTRSHLRKEIEVYKL